MPSAAGLPSGGGWGKSGPSGCSRRGTRRRGWTGSWGVLSSHRWSLSPELPTRPGFWPDASPRYRPFPRGNCSAAHWPWGGSPWSPCSSPSPPVKGGSIWLPRRKGPTTRSISREAPLYNPDPAAYLPHRAPFLHLDRLVALEPGVAATAILEITADSPG